MKQQRKDVERTVNEATASLIKELEAQARSDGSQNLPRKGDSAQQFWRTHHLEFQRIAHTLIADLNLQAPGRREQEQAEYEAYEKQAIPALSYVKRKVISLRGKVAHYRTPSLLVRILIITLIVFFGMTDGGLNAAAIEFTSGMPRIMALGAALVLGAAIGVITHTFAAPWILKSRTASGRSSRGLTVLGLAGSVFYYLAMIRADFQQAQFANEGIVVEVAVLPFAAVSILVFSLGAGLSLYLHRVMKNGNSTLEYADRKELKAAVAEEKRLETEMADRKKKHERYQKEAQENDEFSQLHLTLLRTCAEQAYYQYLSTNAGFRTDGHTFSKEMAAPYPFEFNFPQTGSNSRNRGFLLPILLLVASLAACSPKQKPVPEQCICVVVDQTDPMPTYPSAGEILQISPLHADPYAGLSVLVSTISDVSHTRSTWVDIDAEAPLFASSGIRQMRVKRFTRELDSVVRAAIPAPETAGRGHSLVYQSLLKTAANMKERGCAHTVMLVFSDMQHNEPGISFTKSAFQKVVDKEPETVRSMLKAKEPLVRMENMDIRIIYESRTRDEDESFTCAARFFEHFFEEEAGASVRVQASVTEQ